MHHALPDICAVVQLLHRLLFELEFEECGTHLKRLKLAGSCYNIRVYICMVVEQTMSTKQCSQFPE